MSIYLVKNERNEELIAYTDPQRAEYLAEQLQSATLKPYSVVELVVDGEALKLSACGGR